VDRLVHGRAGETADSRGGTANAPGVRSAGNVSGGTGVAIAICFPIRSRPCDDRLSSHVVVVVGAVGCGEH